MSEKYRESFADLLVLVGGIGFTTVTLCRKPISSSGFLFSIHNTWHLTLESVASSAVGLKKMN
jgi:hypothetical protein